jgi:hypothetical protein
VARKGEGEEGGEEEEDEEEEQLPGEGAPPLEPMGNMGMLTYLKLSEGVSHSTNMAAITGAINTITTDLRHKSARNIPLSVLEESQIGPHLADLGCALSLSQWADLPNKISPSGSRSITTVKDTFYCFKGAPLEAIVSPTPVVPQAAAAPSSSAQELSVHLMDLDPEVPAEYLDLATPKAPSKRRDKGKQKEGASGAP